MFCSLSATNKNCKPLKPHVLLYSNRKNANKLKKSIASQQAVGSYFPVVLFIMLYKAVLTFEPVDEILKANEQYFPVAPFIMMYKVVLTFTFVTEITM